MYLHISFLLYILNMHSCYPSLSSSVIHTPHSSSPPLIVLPGVWSSLSARNMLNSSTAPGSTAATPTAVTLCWGTSRTAPLCVWYRRTARPRGAPCRGCYSVLMAPWVCSTRCRSTGGGDTHGRWCHASQRCCLRRAILCIVSWRKEIAPPMGCLDRWVLQRSRVTELFGLRSMGLIHRYLPQNFLKSVLKVLSNSNMNCRIYEKCNN